MKKQDFAEKLIVALKEYYGPNYSIKICSQLKNNGVSLTGILIAKENENIVPTIYIDNFYEAYEAGEPFSNIFRCIIGIREKHGIKSPVDFSFFSDYEKVRERLAIKLINRELNSKLLTDIPYIEYMDLAIVFMVIYNDFGEGNGCIMIRNEHLKDWGCSVEKLYEDALTNSILIRPPHIESINEVMKRHIINTVPDPVERRDLLGRVGMEPVPVQVLSNSDYIHGASTIVYPGLLEKLAEKIGSFFIIPSSIHEVLILEELPEGYSGYCINNMIREINRNELSRDEVLAEHIYYYDSVNKKLVIPA